MKAIAIAAGSDVPRYAIVGGVPAKTIKMRFTPKEIAQHEASLSRQGVIDPTDLTIPADESAGKLDQHG